MEKGDLSTQSIIKAFSICPIPARSSARDDDGSGQHTVISEGDEPHPRHFDRSEAEWRNLPPLMVRAALRWEISRLRASWERFPSAPYRHAAPLEMTVLASAPLVISTKALRSGEISFLPWYMKHGGRKSPAQSPHRSLHTGPLPAPDDQGQPLTFMEPE